MRGAGDLQRNIANHQRITKGQIGAGQPVNQQIFTKEPRRKRVIQMIRPPDAVSLAKDVSCLFGATVVRVINDRIACQPIESDRHTTRLRHFEIPRRTGFRGDRLGGANTGRQHFQRPSTFIPREIPSSVIGTIRSAPKISRIMAMDWV